MIELLESVTQKHPFWVLFIIILIIVTFIITGYFIYNLARKWVPNLGSASIKIGAFEAALAKQETVKHEQENDEERRIADLRIKVEESTRSVITRQMATINPFIESLKPVFTKIVFSILTDAQNDSLGIKTEIKFPLGYRTEKDMREVQTRNSDLNGTIHKTFEKLSEEEGLSGYYESSELNEYNRKSKTRVFPNLVNVTVGKIINDLEITILTLLVNNNIGKTKGDIRAYVDSKKESIIGIVRNDLCEAYNNLSDKSLYDTHKYWERVGIYYPEDWITDKIYFLFKNCMKIRYSDFEM